MVFNIRQLSVQVTECPATNLTSNIIPVLPIQTKAYIILTALCTTFTIIIWLALCSMPDPLNLAILIPNTKTQSNEASVDLALVPQVRPTPGVAPVLFILHHL